MLVSCSWSSLSGDGAGTHAQSLSGRVCPTPFTRLPVLRRHEPAAMEWIVATLLCLVIWSSAPLTA
eukprot:2516982-Amphidinium_carterae.1